MKLLAQFLTQRRYPVNVRALSLSVLSIIIFIIRFPFFIWPVGSDDWVDEWHSPTPVPHPDSQTPDPSYLGDGLSVRHAHPKSSLNTLTSGDPKGTQGFPYVPVSHFQLAPRGPPLASWGRGGGILWSIKWTGTGQNRKKLNSTYETWVTIRTFIFGSSLGMEIPLLTCKIAV